MAFDGIVLHAVIDELGGLLAGGRVEKIFQTGAYEITLLVHAGGEHYRLLLSADPPRPGCI
ncbi:MAG: NFACT family protein [Clostridia bacterium]|nr:NFACT family protein [Clostridia bacterium]